MKRTDEILFALLRRALWGYLVGATVVLAVAYVLFKKKYYHLHEEYLAGLKKS